METARPNSASHRAIVYWLVVAWAVVFGVKTGLSHLALATNAYDLSVFDYSLWSTLHGEVGRVPFMGESIFSQHFMPILFGLLPIYVLWQSPVLLIAIQIAAFIGAALVFFKLQTDVIGLSPARAVGLVAVFLMARRSHGAVTSFFYPECFQAVLVFGILMAWHQSRWRAYWVQALLLLMTKEDAALYLMTFGVVQWIRHRRARPQAAVTALVASAWIVLALTVALPASRVADGLGSSNPLIADRFGGPTGSLGAGTLVQRLATADAVRHFGAVLVGVGLLPLAAPEYLLVASPGLMVNLAARPGTMQATLIGHYAWAVLPWLFAAAAWGLRRVESRSPRVAMAWSTLLLVGTCVDSPLAQHIAIIPDVHAGRAVRAQLGTLPAADTILAQPNLVPHLPHSSSMFTIGGGPQPSAPTLVVLSRQGDLWPLSIEQVNQLIEAYRNDSRYRQVANGPLYAFVRAPLR